MATAWDMANRSLPSVVPLMVVPSSELMEKWKAEGIRTAMTAMSSNDELS